MTIRRSESDRWISWMVAISGWFSLARVVASVRKRFMISLSVSSGLSTLTATSRSSVSSIALYTVPMPPRPSLSTMRYLPMVLPIMDVVPMTRRPREELYVAPWDLSNKRCKLACPQNGHATSRQGRQPALRAVGPALPSRRIGGSPPAGVPLLIDWDHHVRAWCAGQHQPGKALPFERGVALADG